MKKLICMAMAAVLLLGLWACGAGKEEPLTGTPQEVLLQLMEASGAEFGATEEQEVTAEHAPYVLGLTSEAFAEYVDAAYESQAAISTFAQSHAVVQCKSRAAAAEVKQRIAGGFDSGKWICVFPEQSLVVESGRYVLLAVGTAETTNALAQAWSTISEGNSGTVDVFFTFEGGEEITLEEGIDFLEEPDMDSGSTGDDAGGIRLAEGEDSTDTGIITVDEGSTDAGIITMGEGAAE